MRNSSTFSSSSTFSTKPSCRSCQADTISPGHECSALKPRISLTLHPLLPLPSAPLEDPVFLLRTMHLPLAPANFGIVGIVARGSGAGQGDTAAPSMRNVASAALVS